MDFETSDPGSPRSYRLEPCEGGIWQPGSGAALGLGAGLAATASYPVAASIPPLAIWATLAMGLGAAFAAASHRWVPRATLRAALLLAGLAALWAGSAYASGIENPLRCIGIAGLAAVGMALVPATPRSLAVGLARAAALVLVAWLLDGSAAAWGLFSETPPWSPETAARLLDASPRAFVMEIAGYDWMRSESVYESVGTDRISPTLRVPFANAVAAAPLLVVGSVGICLRLVASSRRSSAHR